MGDFHAGGRRLSEAASDACAVADGEEVRKLGFKLAAQLKTRGVELDLSAIEQGVVICGARRDLIQSVDHLDDIVKLPLRKSKAQVAGNGRGERRTGVGLRQTVLVRAHALNKIAEALNENAAGEHVAERGDVLAVAIGLIKRLGEAV